jgi:hypothetical protein
MGGPSSNPIRCANQNSERKDPGRGICPEGNNERKEPFKSKCDSGMCWAYFMAYGVIESISMSAFVDHVLALELPLSKCYIFLNPFIWTLCGNMVNPEGGFNRQKLNCKLCGKEMMGGITG